MNYFQNKINSVKDKKKNIFNSFQYFSSAVRISHWYLESDTAKQIIRLNSKAPPESILKSILNPDILKESAAVNSCFYSVLEFFVKMYEYLCISYKVCICFSIRYSFIEILTVTLIYIFIILQSLLETKYSIIALFLLIFILFLLFLSPLMMNSIKVSIQIAPEANINTESTIKNNNFDQILKEVMEDSSSSNISESLSDDSIDDIMISTSLALIDGIIKPPNQMQNNTHISESEWHKNTINSPDYALNLIDELLRTDLNDSSTTKYKYKGRK